MVATPGTKVEGTKIEMKSNRFNKGIFFILLLSIILNSAGQMLFKLSRVVHPQSSLLALFLDWQIWVGFILYALSTVVWLWVLSRVQLSYAYPVLALSYPIVVGLSVLLFSEHIQLIHWIGVGLIVCGVSLIPRT